MHKLQLSFGRSQFADMQPQILSGELLIQLTQDLSTENTRKQITCYISNCPKGVVVDEEGNLIGNPPSPLAQVIDIFSREVKKSKFQESINGKEDNLL